MSFEKGRLARCRRGNIGIVKEEVPVKRGVGYRWLRKGINIKTGGPWQSIDPTFLTADEVYELFKEADKK